MGCAFSSVNTESEKRKKKVTKSAEMVPRWIVPEINAPNARNSRRIVHAMLKGRVMMLMRPLPRRVEFEIFSKGIMCVGNYIEKESSRLCSIGCVHVDRASERSQGL